jgi:hypothetical protein
MFGIKDEDRFSHVYIIGKKPSIWENRTIAISTVICLRRFAIFEYIGAVGDR